ncbi:MAG: hypothetical protein KDB53_11575 [Planctomycetes bacterium]|nr:hypothetical protein [Planctomycetota bacterium]
MFKSSRDLGLLVDLLDGLDCCTFERDESGKLRILNHAQDWIVGIFPDFVTDGSWFDGRCDSAFLTEFISDARAAWRGLASQVSSEPWSERDADDNEHYFEARAVLAAGRPVLMIRRLGQEVDLRRSLLQKAREQKLASEREIRSHKDLNELLEKHVQERSVDLAVVNSRLRAEIARRAKAEARLGRLREELTDSTRETTLTEMASALAHELNQPFAAIINYLQGCARMLTTVPLDFAGIESGMKRATAQAERAGGIIRGIRTMVSRGEPRRARVDIETLIDEVLELLEATLNHAGVSVDVVLDFDAAPPRIAVDPIQIQQVVHNLVRNAVEAMAGQESPAGKILIGARLDIDGHLAVTVEDNGPGCDADSMKGLFESFFTTKDSGMGMGLPVCRGIVEAHGGTIDAEQRDEGGLRVRFRIPVSGDQRQS